jgi:hypothetical protein
VGLLKRIVPLKINQVHYTKTIGKMLLGHLKNQSDPTNLRIKYVKVLIHLKDFALRRKLTLHIQGHLWKYFPKLSHLGTQRLLQPWPKRALLLLGSRPWLQPCDANFVGIQNSRIMGPWSLLPRFLRKA